MAGCATIVLTPRLYPVVDELKCLRNRIDKRQTVVGDHAGETIQPCAADHTPVEAGAPVFAVEHKERPKAVHAKEIQLAEVQDQRSFQLRIAADRAPHQVGIGCVYFTVHAQDGCQATRMHM